MPYSDIPDPYGCHDSYAEHFEKEFEKSLQAFGIEVEFIYQHAEYRSGRYNEKILESLYKRKEIYDIVMNFKMEQLYPICYHENKKVMKENQKQLFSILYKLIINQSSGPRIPLLIHVVGIKKFISLLDF
jgi:lysyl-tRNA synthetase class I